MPPGYIADKTRCDLQNPLKDCSFTIASEKQAVKYDIENSKIVTKTHSFVNARVGPFGLKTSDSLVQARSRLKKATGLNVQLFDDLDGTYLETVEIPCNGGAYAVSVLFTQNKKISKVIVSTLPIM